MGSGISTGCDALDALLGSGVERGTLTQFYGPPASGKTNIAISTAVTAAADHLQVLYIDTEGVSPDRFSQITRPHGDDDLPDRITFTDVHDFDEQHEAIRTAKEIAPATDLIILDSATGHYRLERTDHDSEALRTVTRQLVTLLSLARRHDLAVLLTNQVYTDPEADRIRPLGGHTIAHWTGVIVRLDRFRGGNRRATLEKHHAKPAGDHAQFTITESGLGTPTDIAH